MADPSQVDEMVREVRGFAAHMGWRAWTVAELVELGQIAPIEGLRGVTVEVAVGCEPVDLHVSEEGQFVNHVFYRYVRDIEARRAYFATLRAGMIARGEDPDQAGLDPDAPGSVLFKGAAYNWTKTQNGGAEAHIQVCTLLGFVRDRFAPELEVIDETGYFDSGDLAAVERQMATVSRYVRELSRETEPVHGRASASRLEDLLARMRRYTRDARERAN
ncbi:hypothetical protein [Haliangium sp.]|uniref:hypothetical protein n=1 Tax=Haliangium sp. TaxID=2663208 RepID=UPI003D0D03FF